MHVGREPAFPAAGFLVLGTLTLAAAALVAVRAVVVEATVERLVSATGFATVGVVMLVAYRSARQPRT